MRILLFLPAVLLSFALAAGSFTGCTDSRDPLPVCLDRDGDGYGEPASAACASPLPDCDDGAPDIHPGVVEAAHGEAVCRDGLDNDCDGRTDQDDAGCRIQVHAAIEPHGPPLPPSLQTCARIAERTCLDAELHECAVFDAGRQAFAEPPPPFVERIYHYDRYMDLYQCTENSGVGYTTREYQAPGVEEAAWAAPENFDRYVDHGDGAFYMGLYVAAAAHRYAVTGTDADYRRMRDLLEKQLDNWRVNGVPGYMTRATFAMLDPGVDIPPGHPEYNLHTHKERTNHVLYTVRGEQLEHVPAYYHQGVEIDGVHYHTTPTIEGSPSLDAYSGAMLGFHFAYDLLRPEDRALREEIAACVTCFLKRMRKFRIARLQESVLGRLLVDYLFATGAFHPDPDDIDLGSVETLTGYVQEAIPPGLPGDFEFGCPAELPATVDPAYDLDATTPLFPFQLADLISRMQGEGPRPIDFVYFVSHRGGDVAYLINYALLAYHVSGDGRYLDFIERRLLDEVRGLDVLNTAGSFYLPPYCNQWIGGDLVHPIFYATLSRTSEGLIASAHRKALLEEFKNKLFANDNNAYFGITYGAVMGSDADPEVDAYTSWAAEELASYMLDPDHPLDPKRNYDTDYISTPLPGYEPVPPTQEEIDICEQGVALGPIEILPGPGIDPDFAVISRAPLPVGMRVPHALIWHFSPFNLKRIHGDEGRDHMTFIDLTLPFWIGRDHGLIRSGEGMVLAWKSLGVPCGGDAPPDAGPACAGPD